MADYECSPLWEPGGDPYPVQPESLPISAALVEQLWNWAAVYDATLNREDPGSSGFSTEAKRLNFIREGAALQAKLQSELGQSIVIMFHDRY